ncbi:MAG TPA: glycosyltransferase N-terminal domain-containing protein, partial [Chlamydiales bacterium]|nr:glycosyltransferase N-terminal domain-containing protein [Chlamydiales bacterium]
MNLLIFLYLILIGPKLFLDRVLRGKRHPGLLQRLGLRVPRSDRPVIWIHAISVGEVKAAQPLFRKLRETHPDSFFLITTTTATGQAEAHRSLSDADAIAYLPLDFTWVVRRWVAKLQPKLFILIECDFWFNLLAALKKSGARIVLVSGKISQRSARRFALFPTFTKKLFSHFDLLCIQNDDHLRRFAPLVPDPKRLHVTGNLKLDIEPQPIDPSYWKTHLSLPPQTLTISCTHAPEEALLLDALQASGWFIILVPRHPERFNEVAQLLTQKQIPFFRWSHLQARRGGERVLLVDAMGQLPICYSLSRLTLVAGSFIDHIGGHNLLEPCLYGSPVVFGPYTYAQTEFATRAIDSGAGVRLSLDQLPAFLATFPT